MEDREEKLWVSNSPLERVAESENAHLQYQGVEIPP
jgi:hypothetical protein